MNHITVKVTSRCGEPGQNPGYLVSLSAHFCHYHLQGWDTTLCSMSSTDCSLSILAQFSNKCKLVRVLGKWRTELCSASAMLGIQNWSNKPSVRIRSNWEELENTLSAVCGCEKWCESREEAAVPVFRQLHLLLQWNIQPWAWCTDESKIFDSF